MEHKDSYPRTITVFLLACVIAFASPLLGGGWRFVAGTVFGVIACIAVAFAFTKDDDSNLEKEVNVTVLRRRTGDEGDSEYLYWSGEQIDQ